MTDLGRQEGIRKGKVEWRAMDADQTLYLYWEVWEVPYGRFIVELRQGPTLLFKRGYDLFEMADNEFTNYERELAVKAAVKALNLKL